MKNKLEIHCISDTHNRHQEVDLPGGDILIHAGDATMGGTMKEALPFLDWLATRNYLHKVFVPGNHDFFFEENPGLAYQECYDRGIDLLDNSGIEIEGIKFWGSPITPEFHDWAFNRQRGHVIRRYWDIIPDDTEILITHGPAYGILDETKCSGHVGCYDLWERVKKLNKLKLSVCGHIHFAAGHRMVDGRLFVNAASVDEGYGVKDDSIVKVIKDESGYYIG